MFAGNPGSRIGRGRVWAAEQAEQFIPLAGLSVIKVLLPQAPYRNCRLIMFARSSQAAVNSAVTATWNDNAGAIYDVEEVQINLTNAIGAQALAQGNLTVANIAGNTSTAGVYDMMDLTIFGHSQAGVRKVCRNRHSIKQGGGSGQIYTRDANFWLGLTDPITRMTITLSGGGVFMAGSWLSVAGMVTAG